MSSAICFNLDQSKLLSSGNGLKNKAYEEQGIFLSTFITKLQLYHPLL